MKEPRNISNTLVILGCLYALFTYEMGGWAKTGIIFILLFALATWGIWTNPFKEQEKQLLEKRVEETTARVRNLNSLTEFNTSTALLNREQAIWYKTHH